MIFLQVEECRGNRDILMLLRRTSPRRIPIIKMASQGKYEYFENLRLPHDFLKDSVEASSKLP